MLVGGMVLVLALVLALVPGRKARVLLRQLVFLVLLALLPLWRTLRRPPRQQRRAATAPAESKTKRIPAPASEAPLP